VDRPAGRDLSDPLRIKSRCRATDAGHGSPFGLKGPPGARTSARPRGFAVAAQEVGYEAPVGYEAQGQESES
jgi:hypothetical protein